MRIKRNKTTTSGWSGWAIRAVTTDPITESFADRQELVPLKLMQHTFKVL